MLQLFHTLHSLVELQGVNDCGLANQGQPLAPIIDLDELDKWADCRVVHRPKGR